MEKKLDEEMDNINGTTRININCNHLKSMLYVVPTESNWVCENGKMHLHSLSGFLKTLVELNKPEIKDAMQQWGIYVR
ncbi:MAG: hypothetical protein FI718_06350 [SAR202 cluster bacterium]|nr:hypothetical protein [SAR202 cluster bacterium]|tara:strand:+ start:26 stop:259 length:234 start_codon:yes stop_codon:yes gene_type:complete